MTRPVGPFWRYYGGKFKYAPRYPRPETDTIVEPFAGAAGYSCRYPHLCVILVEKSPIIAGLWRYLIGVSSSDVLTIPDIPDGGTVDDLTACQEARWLAGFWCNCATTTPRKTPSAWTRQDDRSMRGWGPLVRRRIARDVNRIRHWTIIEGDYTDAPDVDATWFVDPPYQGPAGSHYPMKVGDYTALGRWVMARRGQLIACDQPGADWMPWTGELRISGATGSKREDGSRSRPGGGREVIYHRSRNPGLFDRETSIADDALEAHWMRRLVPTAAGE